jgi:hypothetical protein
MTWVIVGKVGGVHKALRSRGSVRLSGTLSLKLAHQFDSMEYAELHRNQLAYSGLLKDWTDIKIIPYHEPETEPANECQDQP